MSKFPKPVSKLSLAWYLPYQKYWEEAEVCGKFSVVPLYWAQWRRGCCPPTPRWPRSAAIPPPLGSWCRPTRNYSQGWTFQISERFLYNLKSYLCFSLIFHPFLWCFLNSYKWNTSLWKKKTISDLLELIQSLGSLRWPPSLLANPKVLASPLLGNPKVLTSHLAR